MDNCAPSTNTVIALRDCICLWLRPNHGTYIYYLSRPLSPTQRNKQRSADAVKRLENFFRWSRKLTKKQHVSWWILMFQTVAKSLCSLNMCIY